MVFQEQIKIIFDGLLEFLEKIETRNIRSVKEWVDIPNEVGGSCLSELVSITSYFQFFEVFLQLFTKITNCLNYYCQNHQNGSFITLHILCTNFGALPYVPKRPDASLMLHKLCTQKR